MKSTIDPQKALIFRITHIENLPWILDHGLHCQNSTVCDPQFRPIGNPDLIERRRSRSVPIEPYGTLGDYVPFYFTPHSIMLYNLRTGYGGIPRVSNEDIVFLVSSLRRLVELRIPFVFTNQHAYPLTTEFFNSLDDLHHIDWQLLQSRDFRSDPEDPGKKERYQAEALVYHHLPLAGLLGIACYNQSIQSRIESEVRQRRLALKVAVRREWYF